MSDKNQIEFRVRVTDDGLAPLATKVGAVERATDGLGKSAATAGQKVRGIDVTAAPALDNVYKRGRKAAEGIDSIDAAAAPALENVHKRGRKAAEGIDSISQQLQRVQAGLVALGIGNSFVGLIQGAAQTADQYNNLAARIKLATGEGELFEQAMADVERIALGTNSSLEGTGNLFARLTDAGKSAGLATQEAAAQALELTESINQSIAVSGASAQAGDAALTQLIQGLQSGVLRGEEFNSIMEQSPRLARALADGLGVTTGELRKLSNEGRLTTDVVIGALKSQAATLKSEFESLPPTVGRAVQNLSTAWTVYVGEADKATGASRTAAQAISALAENLDTIAGYLIDAGQAAAAFAALRLAQMFVGLGAAAGVATAATAAHTAATVANTVAQTANAAASARNDLAFKTLAADVARQAAALPGYTAATNAAGVATTAAAASAGRFAAVLSGLKTFTLLGLVTNIKDIGTWLGEGVAKLQGYKDKTDELAQAERARNIQIEEGRKFTEAQALANKAASESQFALSKAAQSSIAAFDELRQGGKSAAEAVADIGKDFDLSSAPGIVNAAAVLDKLAADGKLSADQFSAAWATALKGEDLQAFEVKARAALAGTAREGERLAAIMDGTLREAIRRSGSDFDVLAGGMSKASRSAINDVDTIINGMDRLKAQGVDTGKALEASLSKAIKTADSQAAIDALRSRVEQLRKQLGDQVANGLLKQIEDQASKATGALTGLDGALKKLGITSDVELRKAANETRGLYEEVVKAGGSAREQAAAFERMAAAAVASGDAGALAFTRSQAAARGFKVTTDAAGKTVVRSMKEAAEATRGAGAAADGAAGSYRNMGQSAEQAAASAKKLAEINARYSRPGEGSTDKKDPGRGSPYASPLDKAPVNSDGQTQAEYLRSQRLAGQNAVDNSLQFNLRDKLQAGELTQDDVASLKNAVAALRQREQIDRDVDRMNPAAFSSQGLQDRREWEQVRLRFEEAIARLGGGEGNRVGGVGGGGASPGSTTHNVNISLGGRNTTINTASASDAAALTRFLQDLQDAAGRA